MDVPHSQVCLSCLSLALFPSGCSASSAADEKQTATKVLWVAQIQHPFLQSRDALHFWNYFHSFWSLETAEVIIAYPRSRFLSKYYTSVKKQLLLCSKGGQEDRFIGFAFFGWVWFFQLIGWSYFVYFFFKFQILVSLLKWTEFGDLLIHPFQHNWVWFAFFWVTVIVIWDGFLLTRCLITQPASLYLTSQNYSLLSRILTLL